MDFEEQLEKAERSDSPSLVGSSLRSADDSSHNNYIHPEKSNGKPRKKKSSKKKSTLLNTSVSASLDDLISEGALIGSDEDFTKFLDDDGNVKADAKFLNKKKKEDKLNDIKQEIANQSPDSSSPLKNEAKPESSEISEDKSEVVDEDDQSHVQPTEIVSKSINDDEVSSGNPPGTNGESSSFYEQEKYSTPNLSEYQLDKQINDHQALLDSIQSHDHHRLPNSDNREVSKSNALFTKDQSSLNSSTINTIQNPREFHNNQNQLPSSLTINDETSGLHTPYFFSDKTPIRSSSRSRSRARSSTKIDDHTKDRSRSRSSATPHLARGDSYKNVHTEDPSSYELPADLEPSKEVANEDEQDEQDEQEQDEQDDKEVDNKSQIKNESKVDDDDDDDDTDRRTRQSKPTMGESIAAAEAKQDDLNSAAGGEEIKQGPQFNHSESLTRDPSLVTTGDYTNFNVDTPESLSNANSKNLYSLRSESSTNYLRSISRSRSRQPQQLFKNDIIKQNQRVNEKNDANTDELAKEGALITEDPYDNIGGLDTMVENVLHVDPSGEEKAIESTDNILIDGKTDNKTKTKNSDEESNIRDEDKDKSDHLIKSEVADEKLGELSIEIKDPESSIEIKDTASSTESKDTGSSIKSKDVEPSIETKDTESSVETKGTDPSFETNDIEPSSETKETLETKNTEQNGETIENKGDSSEEPVKTTKSEIDVKDEAIEDDLKKSKSNDDSKPLQDRDELPKPTNSLPPTTEDLKPSIDEETIRASELPNSDDHKNKASDIPLSAAAGTAAGTAAGEAIQAVSTTGVVNDDKDDSETIEEEISNEEKAKLGENVNEKETSTVKSSEAKEHGIKQQLISDNLVDSSPKDANDDESKVDTKKVNNEKSDVIEETNIDTTEPELNEINSVENPEGDKKDSDPVIQKAKSLSAGDIKVDSKNTDPGLNADELESKSAEIESKEIDSASQSTDADLESKEAQVETSIDQPQGDKKDTDPSVHNAEPLTANDIKIDSEDIKKEIQTDVKDESNVEESKSSTKTDQDDDDLDFDVSPEEFRKHLESQPVYIFTSFAGGMQIIPRTNRLVTILQANSIKFEFRDLGTDEEAKKIWKRSSNGRTLPGIVRGDDLIGNWQEIDEANEEYKLHELIYETL